MIAKQLGFALLLFGTGAFAQSVQPVSIPAQPVERGANYCLWQGQNAVTNQDGSVTIQPVEYQELATGLNFLDTATGQWTPSTEQIDILNDGSAVANHAPHQVRFPPDIYTGDLVVTLPDGQILTTHPAGLAYFDGTKSVLIAQLTNSIGVVIGNQVYYSNCLASADFQASLRFTFTKAGLEQDVLIDQRPDSPEAFGLKSAESTLVVLTAFTNTPAPTIVTRDLNEAGLSLADDSLAWPTMQMGQGKAFSGQRPIQPHLYVQNVGDAGRQPIFNRAGPRQPPRPAMAKSPHPPRLAQSQKELPHCRQWSDCAARSPAPSDPKRAHYATGKKHRSFRSSWTTSSSTVPSPTTPSPAIKLITFLRRFTSTPAPRSSRQ